MNGDRDKLKPATRWSGGASESWGPYWDAMFRPAMVTNWINWKRGSTGVNVARRFWEQREYLRRTYEAVHGTDPAKWPSRHPGVVLDAVPSVDHAACLGCQWFQMRGGKPLLSARRHEASEGEFRGDQREPFW